MMESLKKEKACGCLIFDTLDFNNLQSLYDSKVLLILQKSEENFWAFPKGHCEHGETEIETAKREVKEEVGIEVNIFEDKRYEINYITHNNIDKTVVLFVATPATNNLKKQEKEIEDVKWVDSVDVCNVLTYDNLKELYKKVMKDLENEMG